MGDRFSLYDSLGDVDASGWDNVLKIVHCSSSDKHLIYHFLILVEYLTSRADSIHQNPIIRILTTTRPRKPLRLLVRIHLGMGAFFSSLCCAISSLSLGMRFLQDLCVCSSPFSLYVQSGALKRKAMVLLLRLFFGSSS